MPLGLFGDFDHLAIVVVATAAAGAMRQLRLAAVRTVGGGGAGQRVMGPATVTAGFGMAALGIGHRRSTSRVSRNLRFRCLRKEFPRFRASGLGPESRNLHGFLPRRDYEPPSALPSRSRSAA